MPDSPRSRPNRDDWSNRLTQQDFAEKRDRSRRILERSSRPALWIRMKRSIGQDLQERMEQSAKNGEITGGLHERGDGEQGCGRRPPARELAVVAGGETADGPDGRDLIGVDLDLEPILELDDDGDEVEGVQREVLEQEGAGVDLRGSCPGRDVSDGLGDGAGRNVDPRGGPRPGSSGIHGTPRVNRRRGKARCSAPSSRPTCM